MQDLLTRQLILRPFTGELVRAALQDRNKLAQLLAARVPADWPGTDFAEVLPFQLQQLAEDPGSAAWARLILHAADRVLIGDIGFKGRPDQHGRVEIGYSIVPAYRGQGYAAEAACAISDWALQQPGVSGLIAECRVDNLASIRILEKLGMQRTGIAESDEGLLITWKLSQL